MSDNDNEEVKGVESPIETESSPVPPESNSPVAVDEKTESKPDTGDISAQESGAVGNSTNTVESPIDTNGDMDVEEGAVESQIGEGGNNVGRWAPQEHELFLKGLEQFGKDWRKISTVVPTRTLIQIRTHAQKYFQKNDCGLKYDRITDGSDGMERRRVGGKKSKNRGHGRSTYQSTSKVSNRFNHVIMTRSRTPSPMPDEQSNRSRSPTPEPPEEKKEIIPIPKEYESEKEITPSDLSTFPQHYNRSLRPSSMPLSSEDMFSRRITPLGVYYPEERYKQEKQFANVVLEMIEKEAYDKKEEVKEEIKKTETEKTNLVKKELIEKPVEEVKPPKIERRVSIADQIKAPPSHVRPSLRIKNPESLITLGAPEEDYRNDKTAPKTPANVRGNRSILHKAILTSESETRAFFEAHQENISAISYYVNQADIHGFTPLMTSVCLADSIAALNISKLLVEKGAEIETKDRDGNTAFMWAATVGNAAILRYLLEKGANINEVNNEGNSSLHLAILEGREECITILIEEAKCLITGHNNQFYDPLALLNSEHCRNEIWNSINNVDLSAESKMKLRKSFYTMYPHLKTLVIHHPDCNLHIPRLNGSQGTNPWEAPPRIDAILKELHEQIDDWAIDYDMSFPPAENKEILRAHSLRYVKLLNDLDESLDADQSVAFTPHVQQGFGCPAEKVKDEGICDTSFSKGSLKAAMRAAGGAIHGIDKVVKGEYQNAFVCVRPPGHHAGTDGLLTTASSCGFCIFNNVMVGALHALETYPDIIHKVAIVDIDIHHGNGTEQILKKYNHPEKILFWSSHIFFQDSHHDYEFYPGTGKEDFCCNNIYNQPLQPLWETEHRKHEGESGRMLFRKVVTTRLLPLLRSFSPDLIMISSGFDGGHKDVGNYRHVPTVQNGMNLKIEDYEWVLFKINELAHMCCNGRIVSILEGGYGSYEKDKASGDIILARTPFAKNVVGHVHGLLGETPVSTEAHKKVAKPPPGTYCGCGQIRDEDMIQCACGRKCGGWVHYSCAGIDFETYNKNNKDPFICKWCRAEGVDLNDEKKEVKVKEEKKEEEKPTTKTHTRSKKDSDGSYYGGYRHDNSSDEKPRRHTRKRARYSGYGSTHKDSLLLDEDYQQ